MINTWLDKVKTRSLTMADEIVENFNGKIQGASLLLPEPKIDADKHMILNCFIDCLIGAVCRCITEVTNDASARMEDALVENIRAKFLEIRKINLGLSRNMDKVSVDE